MPAKAYPLGEWIPDNPGALQVANNVRAIADGYAPVGSPQKVVRFLGNLPIMGGGSFIDSTGASTLLVARTDSIFQYDGPVVEWVGLGASPPLRRVRFTQFGDNVLFADGRTVGLINLLTLAISTPTAAPVVVDIAQTRDFVMAITTDNALQWSQFNNCANWTVGANQADKQPSLWGQLRRIVGGEYAIAITDRSVVRGTYVGVEGALDIIWQFDEISQEVGCMAASSVCNVGRLIFFLSERGFMMCDGNEVTPIADEKFNRWFFSTYSRSDIANIWAAIDPRNSVAVWAMPGSPGKLIAYNWVLKRATTIEVDVQALFTGYTVGLGLDSLDAIYGNLDAMPISLDDPSLAGGNPILFVVDNASNLNAFTGGNLEATFMLQNIEPTPGVRSRIREIRLVSDAVEGLVSVDARMRAGDGESIVSGSSMRLNGKFPIRSNGRYNNITATIPAGADWSFIQGCEVEFEPGDAR